MRPAWRKSRPGEIFSVPPSLWKTLKRKSAERERVSVSYLKKAEREVKERTRKHSSIIS